MEIVKYIKCNEHIDAKWAIDELSLSSENKTSFIWINKHISTTLTGL